MIWFRHFLCTKDALGDKKLDPAERYTSPALDPGVYRGTTL